MTSKLRFTSTGFECTKSALEYDLLREEFQQRHFVSLPSFVDDKLLELIRSQVEAKERQGEFYSDKKEFYEVEKVNLSSLQLKLSVIFGEPRLIDFIENVTGKSGIKFVEVGIQRMYRESHFIDWHCDNNGHRFSALSINLSSEPYVGGDFQIKKLTSDASIGTLHNERAGDAHLFDIGADLRHRVTPVRGQTSRWFLNLWFGTFNPESFKKKPKELLV